MPTLLELHLILIAVIVCSSHAALTDYDKAAVLAVHNQVRSNVSPTAMNMLTMLWDSNLEASALAYANTCPTGHSSTSYGENLAWGWPAMNITDAASAWAAEAKDYDFALLSCTPGKACGHYKQMVWATTEFVGCAQTTCSNLLGKPQVQVYVCHYKSAGNWVGESAYISGKTCGWCPSGYACNGSLCAKIGTFATQASAATTRRPRAADVTPVPTTTMPSTATTPVPTPPAAAAITPAPTTSAAITPAPTTSAAITPAPTTSAAMTPAPTTSASTTPVIFPSLSPSTAPITSTPATLPTLVPAASASPTTTIDLSAAANSSSLSQLLATAAQQNVPVAVSVTIASPAPSTFVNTTAPIPSPTPRPRRISVV